MEIELGKQPSGSKNDITPSFADQEEEERRGFHGYGNAKPESFLVIVIERARLTMFHVRRNIYA